MKPFSVHPASCSCTSCVYRSRSKEPKVQQIIQGGTEIDKLYYGKYLPLRERKLLEKLIRTRDVYDDVRNQLLSSTSSDQISQEHKRKRRDDASTDKSSAVFKMVDLVDKGQMRSVNASKLNSCCSCCSCETLRKIRKRMEKDKHKHPWVHRHIVTCEDIAKYCVEAEERGKKRRNKLSTKISSKIGAKRLKMIKHLSEPCACTLSLTSMATRSTKALKKIRSKKKVTESAQARKVVTIDQETKMVKLPRKPRKKIKNIQSSTTKDSGTELRSLKVFKIKKDSIILFKEKLLKKRTYEENQDVECDIEFYKDTYPCVKDDEKKDLISGHQKKIKQKDYRRKYKDHGTGYISSRQNISSQLRSSQSFKNIQVGHRLKRCFCTLKLLPSFKPSGITDVVGECNPYECAERIKQRNRRAARYVYKETNTTVTPKKSKLASTSQSVSKSTSIPIHSCECHPQSSNIKCECKVSGDKPERHDNRNKIYKPHVRHETSETNKYDKKKQTYTEAFLQRCLCTLNLLKKNKKKVETLSPWRKRNEYVMHMQNKSVTTNRAEIRYNPERSKLLPYEWEPGLCSPKECDPYDCEKLIKLRRKILQHKYSNSGDLGSQLTFSKTSRTVTSKSRNTQSFTKKCPQKVKKRNQDYNEINIMLSHSKPRVMRDGQKSNLKMSRYKSKDNFITTEDLILVNKHTHNKDKLNTIGSQQFNLPANHTSIYEEANRKEKGSFIFSAIKRYFSTFKFKKNINKEGLENKNNVISESIKTSYPLPYSQICEYKNTCTRLSKLPYGLSSYKCAPNFCNPGLCDPYECYEENKRCDTKGLHDLYVSTDRREKKSVMSVTTSNFSGSTIANSTKSRLLKHKRKQHQKVMDKQRDIKAARSFSPSRHAARKASYYSLNKEISKYRYGRSSFILDTTVKNQVEKYNSVREISAVSRMTYKDTKNKRVALKDDLSQAKEIRKVVKSSNVGFLLKRCFCTLGLQKKNKLKPEFRWHQPITTQFVQVEQNRHNITKSGCKVLNKTLYGRESLKSKLPEGDHLFRENLIGNQSEKHLPKSRSFSRRAHVRSRIEFNFDKMRWLLNTQKINPFYRSFYALNVKVSKSKNIPHNKYRALDNNERRPGECPPNECDPVDCSKRVKRLKHSKVSDTTSLDSQFSCYKRCIAEFKKHKKKGRDKPVTLGSDLSIRAGVYKDTDPYKSSRCQALHLGSDVRVNFDFYKKPPSRGFCRTGPIPYHDRKEARRSHTRPADIQAYGATQSKVGISQMIQRCFCAVKLKNATKSDINQNRDVTRMVKDNPRYISTTRLSHRKEKRERSLKTKSVQYKDYSQQQRKKSHRPTDRNNVTFCTNVNCVEFYNDRTQKKIKLNRVQGRGEGDAGKQKGPIEELTTVAKSEKEDKKKKRNKFIDKCYCTLKHLKRQKHGKYLTQKQSLEMIGKEKKKCKLLDEAERGMETIMPYSKKKFKKLDSQSILAQGTNRNTKQNQQGVCETCKIVCQPIMVELEKKKKKNREKGEKQKKEKKREKGEPKKPAGPVVDNTPLFEMTVNKANMKIVNRDEVLKNLGSSGKESKAMKKARAAIKKGNVAAPVMNVIIDSGNATILNSDQVMHQINHRNIMYKGKSIKAEKKTPEPATEPALTSQTKKSVKKERGAVAKSHGSKCKCCICRGFKKGKTPPVAHSQKLRPCVCGSVLCKKDWDRIYHEQRSRAAVKLKKCVCGSNICGEESSKMPELLLEGARQAEREKEMARRAIIKEKLYQKAKLKRAKERKKALKKENKMRKKQDKRQMKSVKKSVNQGDISLMAESFIDLGTFGSKAFCDIARTMCRAVGHPRDAVSDVRETIKDPGAAAQALQARAEGLGLFSTLSRIKQRMLRMPTAKAAVTTLEAFPATNYLVHMADKDPKKRMKKFKTKRTREALDFQCSLYMASMRKRPCLRIYYMCPWFYPHCMSLLNIWKQFMDILLFVLAVVVWSPCILCMELCRGCVCCCMCQG